MTRGDALFLKNILWEAIKLNGLVARARVVYPGIEERIFSDSSKLCSKRHDGFFFLDLKRTFTITKYMFANRALEGLYSPVRLYAYSL